MDTVVVTGADQLLGHHLMRSLSKNRCVIGIAIAEPDNLPPGTFFQKCSPTSYRELEDLFRELKPSTVFNTSEYGDAEACENHPGKAFDFNVKSVFYLARLASLFRFKLIHFSSDLVFDGHSGPYEERDVTGPLNFYGDTKLQSEEIIQYLVQEFILIRSSLVYGDGRTGHRDYVRDLLDTLQAGESTGAVVDRWVTPTYAGDVARATVDLVDRGLVGLFHIAGEDFVSRNYLAHAVADFFGYEHRLIRPMTSHFLSGKAAMPERGGLRSIKLKAILGYAPGSIREGLRSYAV